MRWAPVSREGAPPHRPAVPRRRGLHPGGGSGRHPRGCRAHQPARCRAGLGVPEAPGTGGSAGRAGPGECADGALSEVLGRQPAPAARRGDGGVEPGRSGPPGLSQREAGARLEGRQRRAGAAQALSRAGPRRQRRQPGRARRALVGRRARRRRLRLHQGRHRRRLRVTSSTARSTAAPAASPARSATSPSTRTASPAICGLRGCLATLVGAHGAGPARPGAAARATRERPGWPGVRHHPPWRTPRWPATRSRCRWCGRRPSTSGIAVAGLLNLLNPAVVIFGGGLARLGDLLLEPLRASRSAAARWSAPSRRRAIVTSAARRRERSRSAPPPWC